MSGKAAKPSHEVARGKKDLLVTSVITDYDHRRRFVFVVESRGFQRCTVQYALNYVFSEILELKPVQEEALKDVFAVLPTACGKSQLAPKVCCYLHDRGFSVQKLPSQSYIIVGYGELAKSCFRHLIHFDGAHGKASLIQIYPHSCCPLDVLINLIHEVNFSL